MASRSLLIFDLDGSRFALEATEVFESVWLPELTFIEEAPPWVVGMFSLRGRIVPVTDLHLRFGRPARHYRLGDQVVVLKTDRQVAGLIVSEVLEVIELASDSIQPPPEFDSSMTHFVAGVVNVGEDLVSLLDVSRLAKLPQIAVLDDMEEPTAPVRDFYDAETTAEVRALFHARAMALRQSAAEEEKDSGLGLAVVELGGEYFAIELVAVQEFCNIGPFSPIPCCPPHILGVMSLRGNLLTLMDPRSALNLPPAARGNKAVITRVSAASDTGPGEQLIGIAVDEVHDVVYLRREDLQAPPSTLIEQYGAEITGTARYAGGTMTVLDLPVLLARDEWIVNENV
ncbi:purine-binding chemotaxis protein CheW [Methylomonas sp. LL1]|uniref:chemotaxis protein CheW n=1 Tax=Methylomonas sp. LL1 TaxID=2785785 RepID=UPI0018C4448B|nr:chemotaxis protein CheW [Methylomonas sp. LL1]QPK62626.1 purine-binding chemotaxis protein CheW [Methylomonas sp. LL1]